MEEFWKLDGEFNLLEKIPRSNGGIIDKVDCDYVEFFTLGGQAEAAPSDGTPGDRNANAQDGGEGDGP